MSAFLYRKKDSVLKCCKTALSERYSKSKKHFSIFSRIKYRDL